MGELNLGIEFWHWLTLGVMFITIELFVPGAFFLGMGVAALIVGATAWLVPTMAVELQLFLFALLSLISIVVGKKILRTRPIESDQPLLNQRGHQYVGRVFTLEEAIVNGQGKIKVDDSIWKVEGQDCEHGTRVKVTGVDGVVLQVSAADT